MFANLLSRLRSDYRGQDLIEYVFMGAFVAVAACSVLPTAADRVSAIFSQVESTATAAAASRAESRLVATTIATTWPAKWMSGPVIGNQPPRLKRLRSGNARPNNSMRAFWCVKIATAPWTAIAAVVSIDRTAPAAIVLQTRTA